MAAEQTDRMTPSDWQKATKELIALSVKAQECAEATKSSFSPHSTGKRPE